MLKDQKGVLHIAAGVGVLLGLGLVAYLTIPDRLAKKEISEGQYLTVMTLLDDYPNLLPQVRKLMSKGTISAGEYQELQDNLAAGTLRPGEARERLFRRVNAPSIPM